MSNIIFPAGFSIDYRSLSLEMMQHYAKMWNLEHTKMEKGHFEGSISIIHTPRIQLATEHYSQSFMSRGDFPDGCIVLIYSTTKSVYNFQDRPVYPNEIIILTKGDEIDILTSGDMDVFNIVIEEQLFYKELYTFFGDIPQSSLQNKRLTINPRMLAHFHNTVSLWTNYLTDELPKLTSTPDYSKIESTILRELFSCLIFPSDVKRKKKFQAKAVRDLLDERLTQPTDISMLIQEFNISESQLHHAFKTDYGITPKKYLQNLRLNAVKKELSLADINSVTIADIAYKYGFLHMSNFTVAYKKMYGETPSQTLNNN